MARGQKRTLEDKITEKQELIAALEIRIKKEKNELDALMNEQKLSMLENLNELIQASNLSISEVTDILKQHAASNQSVVA